MKDIFGEFQAVPAQDLPQRENLPAERARPVPKMEPVKYGEFGAVAIRSAELFAQGLSLADVANQLWQPLTPRTKGPKATRVKAARKRLRAWKRKDKFRDLVYDLTMVRIDNEVPNIISGLVMKARAGRVDAARLLLELNGRHAPNADVVPAAIHINFAGVPRPVELEQREQLNGRHVEEEEVEDAEFEDA